MRDALISYCNPMKVEANTNSKATKKKIVRREYTASDVKLLKTHSKTRTPMSKLTRLMKRSEGSLKAEALTFGIGLGHQR
jgi:hypothetical protein